MSCISRAKHLPESSKVVVGWRGDEYRVAAPGGYFLFTAWDEPAQALEKLEWPRAVRYVLRDGSEEKASVDARMKRARKLIRRQRRLRPEGM